MRQFVETLAHSEPDLRATIPEVLAALLLAGIIFAAIVARVRAGIDAAAVEMPGMVRNGGVWPYSMSQATGWVALLLSWVTVLLGVSLPVWVFGSARARLRDTLERLHRRCSLALVGLIGMHAVLLVSDRMGDSLMTVFVPWTTHYKPGRFPETLGIISLYLAMLLGLSFYLRHGVGVRTWSLLHRYVIPAVYVLALWHTFLYGSDVKAHNLLGIVLWGLQIPVAVGFGIRIIAPVRQHRRTRRSTPVINESQRKF